MDPHALKVLEFDRLLAALSEEAASQPGKDVLLALAPDHRPERAFALRPLFREACALGGIDTDPPRCDFASPLPSLELAAPGGAVLDTVAYIACARFCAHAEELRRFLVRLEAKEFPELAARGTSMPSSEAVAAEARRIFEDDGQMKDEASPGLAAIRPDIRSLESSIRNRLELILKNDNSDLFQEKLVALRNGRFVLPVRRELRGQIKGIVHDESATGRTIFVEPEITVEAGNRLVRIRVEEAKEIHKVMAILTEKLRDEAPAIRAAFEHARLFDAALGVARWALDWRCSFAEDANAICLRQARHPHLAARFRREGDENLLVPLDLVMKPEWRALAITGSNTGGKTLALKTLGLLALMHQSGLPIPAAPGSGLPLFDNVLADIGDEQSIEQSLSTFSGHLRQITHILNHARDSRSLVLLDELGSGTDPLEGGALGCALVGTLAEGPCTTLLTTHLGMIKIFVQERFDMVNASVRFDRNSLRPEYVLEVGIPGASHALAIAKRLGVPGDVLARAESFLSDDQLRLEKVLARLDAQQRQMKRDADEAQRSRDIAVNEMRQVQTELQRLKRERREMLHRAQVEAAGIVDNARREMERMMHKAHGLAGTPEAKELREQALVKRDRLLTSVERNTPKPEEPVDPRSLKIGQAIWVEKLKSHAKLVSMDPDFKRATVDLDGLKVTVKCSEFGRASEQAQEAAVRPPQSTARFEKPKVNMEINLIGQRVEPALEELEHWLSGCVVNSFPSVRIVHGRGTGVLRQAIHEFLRKKKFVKSFYHPSGSVDPSADNVTIVEL